jgi:CRISPR-associated protein Cmr6
MGDLMRKNLRKLFRDGCIPDHAGLAYDVYVPIKEDATITDEKERGKIPPDEKRKWLEGVEGLRIPADYETAYRRWKASFEKSRTLTCEISMATRLLVGHGNPSGSEVGLTLHRTWGVPIIPGSALKGLLAHYIEIVYGPEDKGDRTEDPERAKFAGVIRDGSRILRGPGEHFRGLFGSPPVPRGSGPGETAGDQGIVVFHDALYVPGSIKSDTPFAIDVVTIHQKSYYDGNGEKDGRPQLPNDYDSPNPVQFLTVRPGARFLLALGGPSDWVVLAFDELKKALAEWGIGSKTSLGYGRIDL